MENVQILKVSVSLSSCVKKHRIGQIEITAFPTLASDARPREGELLAEGHTAAEQSQRAQRPLGSWYRALNCTATANTLWRGGWATATGSVQAGRRWPPVTEVAP